MPDIQCIYPNYDDITGHWPRKGSWWRNVSFNFTTDRGWWTTIICPVEPGFVFLANFYRLYQHLGVWKLFPSIMAFRKSKIMQGLFTRIYRQQNYCPCLYCYSLVMFLVGAVVEGSERFVWAISPRFLNLSIILRRRYGPVCGKKDPT